MTHAPFQFQKAYEKRKIPYGLTFHLNRRTQYTAFAFRQFLDALHVVQIFYPFDSACCECFFKYVKKEINCKYYHTLQPLQLSIFEYIAIGDLADSSEYSYQNQNGEWRQAGNTRLIEAPHL